jgi:hypothetical protein
MTSRKKPGVAFWATVVPVVVLVLYPLSFGPACWINCRSDWIGSGTLSRLYRPTIRLAEGNGGDAVSKVILWWANLGASEGSLAVVLDGRLLWGVGWGW